MIELFQVKYWIIINDLYFVLVGLDVNEENLYIIGYNLIKVYVYVYKLYKEEFKE